MKKLFIFLMTIFGINIFSVMNTYAEEFTFYEGNYIPGIYMTKVHGGTRYYQKARFFYQNGSNKFAYCVEPFAMFNENSTYVSSLTSDNLNSSQIDRIKKIAYFGYSYGAHKIGSWYAVTQFMIWKEANPADDIYFTDGLDGNRIVAHEAEIENINQLIRNYETKPSFNNSTINLEEGNEITLIDENNVLDNYTSDNKNIKIDGNKLIVSNLTEGEYTINLTRSENNVQTIPLFYNSSNSQNMMTIGDLPSIYASLKIKVQKTGIEITKVDSDTKTTTASGEAKLNGAIYNLFDENMNLIDSIEIKDDMKGVISNLKYGKYFIKEKKAGIGYQLDTEIHEVIISKDNPVINITLENKVIKKRIEIHKQYGDNNINYDESNISFDILNNKNEIVDTITTSNSGYASILLPFGKYILHQRNTTSGYKLLDDININVSNISDETLELYDYKIEVPNTYINKNNYFITLIIRIFNYVKKILFY